MISAIERVPILGWNRARCRRSEQVRNQPVSSGIRIWSLAQANRPFSGGTLCLQDPLVRTPIQFSGGNASPIVDCSGSYDFHMSHAYFQQHVVPSTTVYAQYWTRDRGFVAPDNVGLTNALVFTAWP